MILAVMLCYLRSSEIKTNISEHINAVIINHCIYVAVDLNTVVLRIEEIYK